ncbi:uncharacterized protein An11g06560 [Aspergillus niger]|uniref:Contig An11c0240, genomic contig n=2 Tax=Aspergillus niger TaxID=5061 RepID=A2QWV1_ASPNC|nr:uncharacterized protein An11g06560 [Aspergillus niger]CAK96953.1 unnamed protein product [Aspergillus niger]
MELGSNATFQHSSRPSLKIAQPVRSSRDGTPKIVPRGHRRIEADGLCYAVESNHLKVGRLLFPGPKHEIFQRGVATDMAVACTPVSSVFGPHHLSLPTPSLLTSCRPTCPYYMSGSVDEVNLYGLLPDAAHMQHEIAALNIIAYGGPIYSLYTLKDHTPGGKVTCPVVFPLA